MNIGIDARLWSESGVGRYIRNLVLGIEKRKIKDKYTIFLGKESYNKIEFKNPQFKKVLATSRWHTLSEQWRFKKEIENERLDLVHFPYFSYPALYKKPFIITIHDLIIDHYPTGISSSLPLPVYKLKHFGYKKIVSESIKNSTKIIVPSYATKDEIVSHYKAPEEKIEVIYEGFDPYILSKKKNTGLVSKNYILYVGNAYPHKNLKRLIDAHKLLSEKMNIDLVCVGRKDFFYERIEREKTKGVYFLHNIADSELFDYYTNARLLAMPSLMEGFGLPVLEAMSLSCPVVCSDTPALREIASDSALYCDPNDTESVAEAIEKVLTDSKIREDLIGKGQVRAKHFSWEECVNKTLHIYESCDRLR